MSQIGAFFTATESPVCDDAVFNFAKTVLYIILDVLYTLKPCYRMRIPSQYGMRLRDFLFRVFFIYLTESRVN